MDITRELRNAATTGKVHLGLEQALKDVKGGKARLVIVSKTCPPAGLERLQATKAPLYRFDATGHELGAAVGKPFAVSVLTVMEQGDSSILSLVGR